MKLWEKIFVAAGVVWMLVVYVAYFKGILGGILHFHPDLLNRLKGLIS